jgi:hypothetical protein
MRRSESGYPIYEAHDLVGHCLCGHNLGGHRPMEAYYGEERLEGKKSSSTALREAGCKEYRESGMTLGETFKLRHCMRRWLELKKEEKTK